MFAEGLAEELRGDGVDVLAVTPAFIRTEFMTLSSFGEILSLGPEAVAKIALTSLGRRRVVTPGWLQKLIAFSTRLQPRFLNTKIFGTVVSRAKGLRASAVTDS